MISADVKSTIKQQEIKDLVAALHLTNFYKKYSSYLQNFKYNVKKVCIFQLILVGIPSIFISSVKNRGVRGGLLNKQNLLSVTEVICRQSLTFFTTMDLIWFKFCSKTMPTLIFLLLVSNGIC